MREGWTMLEPARLALNSWRLALQPRGDGRIVVVLPGFRADDRSTVPIRSYLRSIGYDARGWELGLNAGDVRGNVSSVIRRLEEFVASTGRKVPLIGWSLGGVVARDVARRRPDLVEQVITFGSPISRWSSGALPSSVPVTSIYTKGDGIVPWRSSIDTATPHARNIEVNTTHLGLGLHHQVYVETARCLAAAVSRP